MLSSKDTQDYCPYTLTMVMWTSLVGALCASVFVIVNCASPLSAGSGRVERHALVDPSDGYLCSRDLECLCRQQSGIISCETSAAVGHLDIVEKAWVSRLIIWDQDEMIEKGDLSAQNFPLLEVVDLRGLGGPIGARQEDEEEDEEAGKDCNWSGRSGVEVMCPTSTPGPPLWTSKGSTYKPSSSSARTLYNPTRSVPRIPPVARIMTRTRAQVCKYSFSHCLYTFARHACKHKIKHLPPSAVMRSVKLDQLTLGPHIQANA